MNDVSFYHTCCSGQPSHSAQNDLLYVNTTFFPFMNWFYVLQSLAKKLIFLAFSFIKLSFPREATIVCTREFLISVALRLSIFVIIFLGATLLEGGESMLIDYDQTLVWIPSSASNFKINRKNCLKNMVNDILVCEWDTFMWGYAYCFGKSFQCLTWGLRL